MPPKTMKPFSPERHIGVFSLNAQLVKQSHHVRVVFFVEDHEPNNAGPNGVKHEWCRMRMEDEAAYIGSA